MIFLMQLPLLPVLSETKNTVFVATIQNIQQYTTRKMLVRTFVNFIYYLKELHHSTFAVFKPKLYRNLSNLYLYLKHCFEI